MKLIITENKFKSLINRVVGYDLSDHIEMITNWIELGSEGQKLFTDGRDELRWLLNNFGPMYLFTIDDKKYLVQNQNKEYGWLILSYEKNRRINEDDFLKILGIRSLGIDFLNKIINEFVEE
jgi:hypothetical protein